MSTGVAAAQALAGVVSECRQTNAAVLTDDIVAVAHSCLAMLAGPAIGTAAVEVRTGCVRTRS